MTKNNKRKREEEDEFYKELGALIAKKRVEKDITQENLAFHPKVNIGRSSVANIERGQQRTPIHVLMNIADAIGVCIIDILPDRSQNS